MLDWLKKRSTGIPNSRVSGVVAPEHVHNDHPVVGPEEREHARGVVERDDVNGLKDLLARYGPGMVQREPGSPQVSLMGIAAVKGAARCLSVLLERMDPNTVEVASNRRTSMMLAAANGHTECVRMLMPLVDPMAVDRCNRTALMLAAEAGHTSCVEALMTFCDPLTSTLVLLEHVKPDHWNYDVMGFEEEGRNALMLAAAAGHHLCVKLLMKVTDITLIDANNNTALSLAIDHEHFSCIDPLLASTDYDPEQHLIKALEQAIAKNQKRIAVRLMDHLKDVPLDRSVYDQAFLMSADKLWCLKRMLPLSDTEALDEEGNNALMRAVIGNSLLSVDLLLPLNDPRHRNKQGFTALMFAAKYGETATVQRLLDYSDTNAVNEHGCTALMVGLEAQQSIDCLDSLLRVTDLSITNKQGWCALDLALMSEDKRGIVAMVPFLDRNDLFKVMGLVQAHRMGIVGEEHRDHGGHFLQVGAQVERRLEMLFLTAVAEAVLPATTAAPARARVRL